VAVLLPDIITPTNKSELDCLPGDSTTTKVVVGVVVEVDAGFVHFGLHGAETPL